MLLRVVRRQVRLCASNGFKSGVDLKLSAPSLNFANFSSEANKNATNQQHKSKGKESTETSGDKVARKGVSSDSVPLVNWIHSKFAKSNAGAGKHLKKSNKFDINVASSQSQANIILKEAPPAPGSTVVAADAVADGTVGMKDRFKFQQKTEVVFSKSAIDTNGESNLMAARRKEIKDLIWDARVRGRHEQVLSLIKNIRYSTLFHPKNQKNK